MNNYRLLSVSTFLLYFQKNQSKSNTSWLRMVIDSDRRSSKAIAYLRDLHLSTYTSDLKRYKKTYRSSTETPKEISHWKLNRSALLIEIGDSTQLNSTQHTRVSSWCCARMCLIEAGIRGSSDFVYMRARVQMNDTKKEGSRQYLKSHAEHARLLNFSFGGLECRIFYFLKIFFGFWDWKRLIDVILCIFFCCIMFDRKWKAL